jgi:hypothetical protein
MKRSTESTVHSTLELVPWIPRAVTQHITAWCSAQIVGIILTKHRFINITSWEWYKRNIAGWTFFYFFFLRIEIILLKHQKYYRLNILLVLVTLQKSTKDLDLFGSKGFANKSKFKCPNSKCYGTWRNVVPYILLC